MKYNGYYDYYKNLDISEYPLIKVKVDDYAEHGDIVKLLCLAGFEYNKRDATWFKHVKGKADMLNTFKSIEADPRTCLMMIDLLPNLTAEEIVDISNKAFDRWEVSCFMNERFENVGVGNYEGWGKVTKSDIQCKTDMKFSGYGMPDGVFGKIVEIKKVSYLDVARKLVSWNEDFGYPAIRKVLDRDDSSTLAAGFNVSKEEKLAKDIHLIGEKLDKLCFLLEVYVEETCGVQFP